MLALHHLIASSSIPNPKWRPSPPQRAVPVTATGPVRLVLAVNVDGDSLAPDRVLDAPATRHLAQTLRAHSDALNVQNVSDAFVEDGSVQIELSPVLFADSPRVHAVLHAIRLSYTWSTAHHDCHPWAAQHTLLLPHREALDGMHAVLVQKHLLGSYPYIFGPWRKALEAEKPAIGSLARSVARIVARSPNAAFKRDAEMWLDRLAKQNASSADAAYKALGKRGEGPPLASKPEMHGTVHTALLALYTRRVRPAAINRCKGKGKAEELRAASPVLRLDDLEETHEPADSDLLCLSEDGLDLLAFDDDDSSMTMHALDTLDDDAASLLLDLDASADAAEAAAALNMLSHPESVRCRDLDAAAQFPGFDRPASGSDDGMVLFSDCDRALLPGLLDSSQGSSSLPAADAFVYDTSISACAVPESEAEYDMLDLDFDLDGSQSAGDIDHLPEASCEELGQKAQGLLGGANLNSEELLAADEEMLDDGAGGEEEELSFSLCAF